MEYYFLTMSKGFETSLKIRSISKFDERECVYQKDIIECPYDHINKECR